MSKQRPIRRFFETVFFGASKNEFLDEALWFSATVQILPTAFDVYAVIQSDPAIRALLKVSLGMNAALTATTALATLIAYSIGKNDEKPGDWKRRAEPTRPKGPPQGENPEQDSNELFKNHPLPERPKKVLEFT